MTAVIAKKHLAHLAGGSLAYSRPAVQGLEGTVADLRRPGLRALFARLTRAAIEYPRRRAVLDELSMLSDRELADVGLDRADLVRVYDPAFAAARHDARRN